MSRKKKWFLSLAFLAINGIVLSCLMGCEAGFAVSTDAKAFYPAKYYPRTKIYDEGFHEEHPGLFTKGRGFAPLGRLVPATNPEDK